MLGTTPEPWEPWHCLAVYKVRNMLMGTYEMKLWRSRLALGLGAEKAAALFQDAPQGTLVTTPPGATLSRPSIGLPGRTRGRSSAVQLARRSRWRQQCLGHLRRTHRLGLPLLAGDSHRALDTPNVYYQIHITCPAFRVSGYAVPGIPGAPHFSHTGVCRLGDDAWLCGLSRCVYRAFPDARRAPGVCLSGCLAASRRVAGKITCTWRRA